MTDDIDRRMLAEANSKLLVENLTLKSDCEGLVWQCDQSQARITKLERQLAETARYAADWRKRAEDAKTREEADNLRLEVLRREKAVQEAQAGVFRSALERMARMEPYQHCSTCCQMHVRANEALATNAGKAAARVIEAALLVGRLNYVHADSIRPRTNGAQDAFHRLEAAANAYMGIEGDYPQNDV